MYKLFIRICTNIYYILKIVLAFQGYFMKGLGIKVSDGSNFFVRFIITNKNIEKS